MSNITKYNPSPTKQIPRQAPHMYVTHTNLQTLQLRSEILTSASYFNNLGFNTFNLRDAQTQYKPSFLTFVGPCIVIYFYSKTNQMYNNSDLFYFGTTLCMFRTVSPSIIRSLTLYIRHQVRVIQVLWLLAGNGMMLYVQS
jgi:hypothetical protein